MKQLVVFVKKKELLSYFLLFLIFIKINNRNMDIVFSLNFFQTIDLLIQQKHLLFLQNLNLFSVVQNSLDNPN